jgi:hypothetical protein
LNIATIYGRFGAGLFTLLFTISTMWQAGHVFFQHQHDRHALPVCLAAHDDSGGTHLHDQRYQGETCSLCAFIFAVPELIEWPALPALPAAVFQRRALSYLSPACHTVCTAQPQRGPPAA